MELTSWIFGLILLIVGSIFETISLMKSRKEVNSEMIGKETNKSVRN